MKFTKAIGKDENGKVVEKIEILNNGLLMINISTSNNYIETLESIYNEDEYLLSEVCSTILTGGKNRGMKYIDSIRHLSYDHNNNIQREIYMSNEDGDDSNEMETIVKYYKYENFNKKYNIANARLMYIDNELIEIAEIDKRINAPTYVRNLKEDTYEHKSYDTKGNIKSSEEEFCKTCFDYDENGNLVKESVIDRKTGNSEVISEFKYIADSTLPISYVGLEGRIISYELS